ncbi:MAG: NADH-quinone oxidoreductase subunit J [Candidatus Omnitrophica bacterium]|nr:NADH-quinone oxidoreductase subunit J [Candidatus Omnitrophota bacterium]
MNEAAFYFIAAGVCVFAVMAVTGRDIFHCALWLAMTLLSVAGIYFYLDAPFLGVIQILVYVGGIITLFVFAIKLTANIGYKSIRQTSKQWALALFITALLLCVLSRVFAAHPWAQTVLNVPAASIAQIGRSLMMNYAVPFEFMSVILLAAMVGAIVIGKDKR